MSDAKEEPLDVVLARFVAIGEPRIVNPEGWFWKVGNRAGGDDIYSGAAAAYMAETDSRYTDWLALGNIATNIFSDGELADVLWKSGASYDKIAAAGWTDWGFVPLLDAAQVVYAAGAIVTSTGTPAIDGIHGLTAPFIGRINTILTYLASGGTGFPPGNSSTKDWPTLDGGTVVFPSTAVFTTFAMAIADYEAKVNDWALGGGTELPPRTISIA